MIAVDPGTTESAFVLIKAGQILDKAKIPNADLLALLQSKEFRAEPLVIETMTSTGMAVGETTFTTLIWIGRFIQSHGGQRRLMRRMEVKMHLCRDSKAKDQNIRQSLINRFGEPGTKKKPGIVYGFHDDLWSALAIAVTALETRGTWVTGNQ